MKYTETEAIRVISNDIYLELERSNMKHGEMPENMFEQITIVNEEIGEVSKAILDFHYEDGTLDDVRKELIQSCAMCVKMLLKMFPFKIHKP